MGFNLFSFQPSAFVGNERCWKEDYRALDPDNIWSKIEEGAGSPLPYRVFQTGDEGCNRTAFGFYIGDRWYSLLEADDPEDLAARKAFFTYLGGVHWIAPPPLLAARLSRVLLVHSHLAGVAFSWLRRLVHRVGGIRAVVRALHSRQVVPMTFVMHRFRHAEDVAPAWELLQRGEMSTDPQILETQERLQAGFYAMAHSETGQAVPACVQHSVLEPAESRILVELLPVPRTRKVPVGVAAVTAEEGRSC